MNEPTIVCPECHAEIPLSQSLAAPLIDATRLEYEKKLRENNERINRQEEVLLAQQKSVEESQRQIDDKIAQSVASQLSEERANLIAAAEASASSKVAAEIEQRDQELAALKQRGKDQDQKLAEAQKAQAQLIIREREIDDAKREIELTVQRKVQEDLDKVRASAISQTEENMRLKVSEKEQTISSMQRTIDELKRKADQGSQQLQGEVLELQLEGLLASRFPMDVHEPVAKGEFGGDLLHRIVGPNGQTCGSILWETKRTKNWSDGWLTKLRTDQRAAKAELSILISETLPKGVESFDFIDGVWIAHPRYVLPVAVALRQTLIEVSSSRTAREGQETKMELVYSYLTGPNFRHRIEAIVERFTEMQDDLNRERKAMTRLWAKREAQIQGVVATTVGMYGDLQGIAGRAMQEIPALEIPLLADENSEPF